MSDTLGRGWLGSLRRRVAYEIKLHKRSNPVMRRARYSIASRILRAFLVDHSFLWFLTVYLAVDIAAAFVECIVPSFAPQLLPGWTGSEMKGLLKDTAGYLISAQVGVLGVVSVAVGLVTLIAQRDDRSSTNTDVRLYYVEALAYEVIASSAALLVVLCLQIFWPIQFVVHVFAGGTQDLIFKGSLTLFHAFWLCVNLAAFAQFLATSLRFVEPRAREQMRERYTANSVIPDDLSRRLFRVLHLMAPKILLPDAAKENGPLVSFGHSWLDGGSVEIKRRFSHPIILRDVRTRLLGRALQSWWQRTAQAREQDKPLDRGLSFRHRKPSFALMLSFDGEFAGNVDICRQDDGQHLDSRERFLIRLSLSFSRVRRREKRDLPTPANLLEELADKVVGQIDRLAITGFKSALDEMLRYHRFLIDAYNTQNDEGRPANLAEFGGIWTSPLEDWIHQYRRIFERVADKVAAEPSIVETMAHLPYRLLPNNAASVSKAVVTSVLDLGLHLVVMLEGWVTRRTTVEVTPGDAAQPRLSMAGSDQRAYDRVLLGIVGAWENILRHVDGLYGWSDAREEPPSVQWKILTTSWSFLERHLRNSTYILALAVWNEDAAGADRYRDLLLRWLDSVRGEFERDYILRHQSLLTPELFTFEWSAVEQRLTPFIAQRPFYKVAPTPLFASIVRRSFDDVVLITAAVVLAWYMNEQQASDIGGETALLLVKRKVMESEGSHRTAAPRTPEKIFDGVLSTIIRADLNEELNEGTYRGSLDGLIGFLDRMSERRVVPGRVYTSWGRDGLDTITLPLLAILMSNLPENGDDRTVTNLTDFASTEELFSDADASLRRILASFDRLNKALVDPANRAVLDRGVQKLSPTIDVAVALDRLTGLFARMSESIETQRTQRLRVRPIDTAKLQAFDDAMEKARASLAQEVHGLTGFQLRQTLSKAPAPVKWHCGRIDKGQLTTPELSLKSSDLEDFIANMFRGHLVDLIWASFSGRSRTPVQIPTGSYPAKYWHVVIEHASRVGTKPTLIVPYEPTGEDITTWLYSQDERQPADLRIEHLEDRSSGSGLSYMATVGGIDVYSADIPKYKSLLYSATALRSVDHAAVTLDRKPLSVAFEEGSDSRDSALVVTFDQSVHWDTSPTFEFILEEFYLPEKGNQPRDTASAA
jgi:hypothetical protein